MSGSIRLNGRELAGHGPAAIRSAGLGYVPEERMRDGVVGDFSVAENLLLVDYGSNAYSQLGFLRQGAIRRHCQDLVAEFNVKTPNLETPARSLSGGNIQKLIMARELSAKPQVLLVAQPTRGIDVSASLYIHQRLVAQRDSGTATIIISEDLDEVMTISDRILVMYEGSDHRLGRPAHGHPRGDRDADGGGSPVRRASRRRGTARRGQPVAAEQPGPGAHPPEAQPGVGA